MKKSLEQMIEDERKLALDTYYKQVEQKRAETAEDLARESAAIDRRVAESEAAVKQKREDALAAKSASFDKAAIQQLVDRKNAEERMSDLGLLRSGTAVAARAGADNRRRVTEADATNEADAAIGRLDEQSTRIRANAAADKKDAAAVLNRKLQAYIDTGWQSALSAADAKAQSLYKAELAAETRASTLYAALAKKLEEKTNGVYTLTPGGEIKKKENVSLFTDMNIKLQKISGGQFGVSDKGTIVQMSAYNKDQLAALDEHLRTVSKGAYGILPNGSLYIRGEN